MYLVVATSGRAIAQGLKANNFDVLVVDAFNDMDTCSVASHCKKVDRHTFGLQSTQVKQAVSQMQDQYTIEGVLYDAAIEADPDLLDELAIDPILGNTSNTLRQCKDPKIFFSYLDECHIPYPDISFDSNVNSEDKWLVKYTCGTGGMGVKVFDKHVKLNKNAYFQRQIDGVNFSLLFLADGNNIQTIGFNELWSEKLSNKLPCIYLGAINKVNLTLDQQDNVKRYAKHLTQKFKLVGINSIDCILSNSSIFVLEVNPRIPATYDLYETRKGELLNAHIHVCVNKSFLDTQLDTHLRAHMVVYAHEDMQIPENFKWPLWTADRPYAGEIIVKHEPICNVFAGGKNSAQVKNMLQTRRETIIYKLHNKKN